ARDAGRLPRLRHRVPRPRAERLVLRAVGVPPPRDRLVDGRLRDLPARPRAPSALDGAAVGLRARIRRRGRDALLRPRPRAGVRSTLAARGGAAPLRRAALVALVALAVPAQAFAHATLRSTTPGFQQELRRTPAVVGLHFDQTVSLPVVQVLDFDGRNHALAARSMGKDVVARVQTLPRGVYTIRWHALSADPHVVSGVWTFGV